MALRAEPVTAPGIGRARLPRIAVPVLVVCGAGDFAFPLASVQEMARLIPRATLKVYDRGHPTVLLEKRFATDIREFIQRS